VTIQLPLLLEVYPEFVETSEALKTNYNKKQKFEKFHSRGNYKGL